MRPHTFVLQFYSYNLKLWQFFGLNHLYIKRPGDPTLFMVGKSVYTYLDRISEMKKWINIRLWIINLHCPKGNQNFRDITWKLVENIILHELFRVVSGFPRYISCYIAENGIPLGQCMAQEIKYAKSSKWISHIFHTVNFYFLYVNVYGPNHIQWP